MPTIAGDRAELARLVRSWRERMPADCLPNIARRPGQRGVSQVDLAAALGISPRWYGRIERAVAGARYEDAFLSDLADLLRLGVPERRLLWQLATGHVPPAPALAPITPQLRRLVTTQLGPAYIADQAWDVQVTNVAFARWFPELARPGANIMLWTFLSPAARACMVGWAEIWLPPMVAELQLAASRYPGNARLAQVIAMIRSRSSHARQLWHERVRVAGHPHGVLRSITPAHLGGQTITYSATVLCPLEGEHPRLTFLHPEGACAR